MPMRNSWAAIKRIKILNKKSEGRRGLSSRDSGGAVVQLANSSPASSSFETSLPRQLPINRITFRQAMAKGMLDRKPAARRSLNVMPAGR